MGEGELAFLTVEEEQDGDDGVMEVVGEEGQ
jgi:hypothetical protein